MPDTLFVLCALATAAAVVFILIKALRQEAEATEQPAELDAKVYRDQLGEIERDFQRGTLSEAEASRLRNEVARRLLEADRKAQKQAAISDKSGPRGWLTATFIVVIIALSGGLYLRIGAPGTPDLPLKARIAQAEELRASRASQAQMEANAPATAPAAEVDPSFLELVEKLREAVANRPDDLEGQRLLARNEANLGNLSAAQAAQRRVIALKGSEATADDHMMLASFMIQAAGGRVSPEAEAAIRAALALDPTTPSALFFAGIANMQVNRHDLAFQFWRELIDKHPSGNPWSDDVRARLPSLAVIAGQRYELPPVTALNGPTAADIEAAASLSAEERAQMVQSMVDGLAARLAQSGGTAAEWAQLITALGMLGETERASAIWLEAQSIFAGRTDDLAQIRASAESIGLIPKKAE